MLRNTVSALAIASLGGCSTVAPISRSTDADSINSAPSSHPKVIHATLASLPGHVATRIGSWAPWTTAVSKELPSSLKGAPEHSAHAVFGEFSFGDGTRYKHESNKVGFMLDEERQRFIVDQNRNGTLDDDKPASWSVERFPILGGSETAGTVTVRAEIATSSAPDANSWSVAFFFSDRETREKYKSELSLNRYRDYATEGFVTFGERTYRILLDDSVVTGDFSASPSEPRSDLSLRIDVNDNGSYENRGEAFDANTPFNIDGKTYEISQISRDGTQIEFVESKNSVSVILPPPDLRVGKSAPQFAATTTEGLSLRFPNSYEGKIVMLDFWASWCGPCVRELPNLKEAYSKFHEQGFEILSISIDRPEFKPKALAIIQKEQLCWSQVIDTGGWQGELISLYAPAYIPATYLVDGSTGKILASMDSLRGRQLRYKLEEVFSRRAQK